MRNFVHFRTYSIVLLATLLTSCVNVHEKLEKIVSHWRTLGTFTYDDWDKRTVKPADFDILKASVATEILDFSTGKNVIAKLEKGQDYAVLAQTRFIVDPTDKNWKNFLVVKFDITSTKFWDGLILIPQSEVLQHKNLMFWNCQYHYFDRAIATTEGEDPRYSVVYVFEQNTGVMRKLDNQKLNKLEFKPKNGRNFSFIELVPTGDVEETPGIFKFLIFSDEVHFGSIFWNYDKDTVSVELKKIPTDTYSGLEF